MDSRYAGRDLALLRSGRLLVEYAAEVVACDEIDGSEVKGLSCTRATSI